MGNPQSEEGDLEAETVDQVPDVEAGEPENCLTGEGEEETEYTCIYCERTLSEYEKIICELFPNNNTGICQLCDFYGGDQVDEDWIDWLLQCNE